MTDDILSPADISTLRDRVHALLPTLRTDLEALARIPSVSLSAFDQARVDESADAVAALFRAEGLDVEIVREGGRPAVLGHLDGPPGAPTVLLYAHHDVQPTGEATLWDSPPFEPTERAGRLYGRGVADDKAGITVHLAALRALTGALPVGIKIFIEGEEEIGSDSLPAILQRHRNKLSADAIVLADSGNWEIGTPALTTTLRGLVRVVVTVRTLDHAIHSGMFGGAVPDALTTLIRLISTLHDEHGNLTVEGLKRGTAADLAYDEARLRRESGMLGGTQVIGTEGSILTRLWNLPSMTTIGMDVPSVDESSNTLLASARAKLSMRIAPDERAADGVAALERHLRAHVPWGAEVDIVLDDTGEGFAADVDGPMYDQARAAFRDAWGVEPVDAGVGGSIPFVAAFAEQFPQAALLVTGVEDPDSRAHGANESLHLDEWERACVAEAVLLARIGALPR